MMIYAADLASLTSQQVLPGRQPRNGSIRVPGGDVFEADGVPIAGGCEPPKKRFEIEGTRSRFMAAGMVGDVYMADPIDVIRKEDLQIGAANGGVIGVDEEGYLRRLNPVGHRDGLLQAR